MEQPGQVEIAPHDALIVVDVQNDFLPGGSLAVQEGSTVIEPINALMPVFPLVYATRDWHPPNHRFFQRYGGPWPDHCLAGTAGAQFAPGLNTAHVDIIVSKGTDPETDGYSGFAATHLDDDLRRRGVRRVFVCGLATDYCVKATALDARRAGFETFVITDAIAAVNVEPGDAARALEELHRANVTLLASSALKMPAARD